ncbi:DUF2946 family protein [Thioclava pacifica]|uniref:DUF2946 family protein n=1 Tax=Thioclava pacifica TaxID=285109 RepID=UPI0012F90E85|nr:DUF2946 family protein [Thioclava pacifica]
MARRLVSGRVLALVAMLLQALFYADHIGAAAAAEFGRAAPGARLGLLQICTGEGIVLMTPDGRVVSNPTAPAGSTGHGHGSNSDCAVCSSASVCGFDAPKATPLPIFAAQLAPAPFLSLRAQGGLKLHRDTQTPIRAPPVG